MLNLLRASEPEEDEGDSSEEDEEEEKKFPPASSSMLYSCRAVTNALLNKMAAKYSGTKPKSDIQAQVQISAADTETGRCVDALEEENIFRQMAKSIQTSSGDRKIPVVANKGTASWMDEEGAFPESDDSIGQVSIGAYKLGTMIKVSEELLNDSVFDLESYITREFARRVGSKEEEAFFMGNDTGKPLGILAETGGAQTGITAGRFRGFPDFCPNSSYTSLQKICIIYRAWSISQTCTKQRSLEYEYQTENRADCGLGKTDRGFCSRL